MRTFVLDGTHWETGLDFYRTLLGALEPINGHGLNVNAFIDSMIYGGMLRAEPPYEIIVQNVSLPPVRLAVEQLSNGLADARIDRRRRRNDDVEVTLRFG